MFISRLDKAAEYRRQAQQARAVAAWISLNDVRQQLLETARHLEVLAEEEETGAREASLNPPCIGQDPAVESIVVHREAALAEHLLMHDSSPHQAPESDPEPFEASLRRGREQE